MFMKSAPSLEIWTSPRANTTPERRKGRRVASIAAKETVRAWARLTDIDGLRPGKLAGRFQAERDPRLEHSPCGAVLQDQRGSFAFPDSKRLNQRRGIPVDGGQRRRPHGKRQDSVAGELGASADHRRLQ